MRVGDLLGEAKLLDHDVHRDDRGFFVEALRESDLFSEVGMPDARAKQVNVLSSGFGVVRGVHTDARRRQAKLVRCVSGQMDVVVVDLRPESEAFGHFVRVGLNGWKPYTSVFIPPGYGHACQSLSSEALLMYVSTEEVQDTVGVGISPISPDLGIDWQVPPVLVKQSDLDIATLAQFKESLACVA